MDYFTKIRSELGDPSLRKLAEQSGVKHTRLGDLFKQINGVPTFDEFIILCDTFSVNPKAVLQVILDSAERLKEEQRALSSISVINDDDTDDSVPLTADHEDISAMSDEERIEVAKREYAEKPWELAALHDPNKKIEMLGDAGPDWDDPA